MSKTPNTNRTRPLDRDGDGKDGGSLPGNQTAPMAATDPVALVPGETLLQHSDGRAGTFDGPEDDGRLRVKAPNSDGVWIFGPDECRVVAELPPAWARDNDLIVLKLGEAGFEIDPTVEDAVTGEQVAGWTEDQARAVEMFADEYVAGTLNDDGDMVRADGSVIELPTELARNVMAEDEPDADTTTADLFGDPNRPDDGPPNSEATPPATEEVADPTAETPAPQLTDPVQPAIDAFTAGSGETDEQANVPQTEVGAAKADYVITIQVNPREADEPLTFGVDSNVPGLVVEEETLQAAIDTAGRLASELLNERGETEARPLFVVPEEVQAADAARIDAFNTRQQHEDTFTAEEIAAGATPVVQEEGEQLASVADTAPMIDADDPIVTVETATAPVAVRLRNLQRLVDNRWLYRFQSGYAPGDHGPYVDAEEVDVWVRAGLALYEPTAGNNGGVRVEAAARSLLARQLRQDAA